jgi:hypothetical protein
MNDIKLVIKGTRLFKQVASVVGNFEAHRELTNVALSRLSNGRETTLMFNQTLGNSFNWESSSQGRRYWENIHNQTKYKDFR